MNIEPGKLYKTRDGNVVRVYATDCGGLFPVHAAVYRRSGEKRWAFVCLTAEGTQLSHYQSGLDVMEECANDEVLKMR